MLLYFAAPLFNDAERAFNAELAELIEGLGYRVFLPQRDGAESDRAPYDTMTRDERRATMFALDRDQIMACDLFLYVTDGRVPDEGAAVELGIAYAHRQVTERSRTLIGLRTDVRTTFASAALSPMISQALDVTFDSTAKLLNGLRDILRAEARDRPEPPTQSPRGGQAGGAL